VYSDGKSDPPAFRVNLNGARAAASQAGGVRGVGCAGRSAGASLASDQLSCVGLHVSHPKAVDRFIKLGEITKVNRCLEKGVISEH
jgi:hypothetical protein